MTSALTSAGAQVLEAEARPSLAPASTLNSEVSGGLIGGVSGSRGVQPELEVAAPLLPLCNSCTIRVK